MAYNPNNSNGQKTMANSAPVVVASDQSAVPISAASLPSHPVTNAGTFAVQATEADGANTTLGTKADAKSTATDTTAVSVVSVLKQISASVQAPPTQAVTGTFWQATQPVSGSVTANIGTSGSLALDATLTGGTQQAKITDGTNIANTLKSDGTAAGQNAQLVAGTYKEISFTTTTVQAVASSDVSNYSWVSVHITTQGTSSTVNFQISNDNTNWVAANLLNQGSGTGTGATNTTSAAIVYSGALIARYFRLNITGISAGTTAGVIELYTETKANVSQGVSSAQNGTWTVQPGNTVNTSPWLTSNQSATTGGYSKVKYAAQTTTVQTVKGTVGTLGGYVIYNPNATVAYVQLFDVATATTVTLGTTVPDMFIPIPATSGANVLDGTGIAFANGIKLACTTTATGLTAPGTGLDLSVFYK